VAVNLSLFPEPPEPVESVGVFDLRPYQHECVESIFRAWEIHDSVLIVQATGLGKTVTFAEVIARWPDDAGRILVVVHREELMQQACEKLKFHTGAGPQVEMGQRRADREGYMSASPVVVTSVQTMSRVKRHQVFDPEDFGLVIVDEAHHVTAASYRRVLEYFQPGGLKVLGVTATPKRRDKKALGTVFANCSYDMGLREGIEEGWLVPIAQRYVTVEGLDFSWIRKSAGDFNEKQLAEAMGGGEIDADEPDRIDLLQKQERMLHAIVSPTLEEANGRPTLVFAVTKEHARRLTDVFNRHPGVTAQCVVAETPRDERRWAISQFQRGALQVLVNVGVFTEGFDAPAASVIAVAAPTLSESRYIQQIGRGTRPLAGLVDGLDTAEERRQAIADSDKPRVTVLDFVGNSGRHRLVSTPDVLAGDYDLEDIEAAKLDIAANGTTEDVEQAVAFAKAQREMREAKEAARRAEEEAKRRQLRADARYTAQDVDPFGYRGTRATNVGHYQGGATTKQVQYLVRLGVSEETANGYSKGQAGSVIDRLSSTEGADYVMRFGKFQGRRLRDIPTGYLNWLQDNIDNADLRSHIDKTLDG
jgi:superfamily II DNA or RNA helicase